MQFAMISELFKSTNVINEKKKENAFINVKQVNDDVTFRCRETSQQRRLLVVVGIVNELMNELSLLSLYVSTAKFGGTPPWCFKKELKTNTKNNQKTGTNSIYSIIIILSILNKKYTIKRRKLYHKFRYFTK